MDTMFPVMSCYYTVIASITLQGVLPYTAIILDRKAS